MCLIKRSIEMNSHNSNENNNNNNHDDIEPDVEPFADWEDGDEDEGQDPDSLMLKNPLRSEHVVLYQNEHRNDHLSKEAERFIEENFDRNNVQRVRESMEADGYDNEGPLAKIWELLIQTNDGMIHFFSYENRYRPDELPGYRAN